MKIIVVPINDIPRTIEIDGSLESMQAVVGGVIQIYPLDNADEIVIICNEEGKINGSCPNRVIIGADGSVEDVIYGDFFLCSAPPDSEDLKSIPDHLVDEYIRSFSF